MSLRAVFIAASITALTACGGGSSSSNTPNADASGWWLGSFAPSTGTVIPVIAAIHNGELLAFAFEQAIGYSGSVSTSGNSIQSNLSIHDAPINRIVGTSTVSGTITERQRISGTYSTTLSESGSVTMRYMEESDRPASTQTISATWSASTPVNNISITFNTDGRITGATSDGCNMNGAYTIPNAARNLYQVRIVQSCPRLINDFAGYAYIGDRQGNLNSTLVLILRDGDYMSATSLFK